MAIDIPTRNMTRQEQKLYELNLVQLFRKAGGIGSSAELQHVPDHLSRPDIQVRSEVISIGIEIRNLYNDEREGSGSQDRKRSGVYQSIVNRCTELHSRSSTRRIVVRISFNKQVDINQLGRRERKNQIAEMLVGLVEGLQLQIGDLFELRSEDLWGPQWPEEVMGLGGVLLEGDGPPEWNFSDSCWVDETTDEIIQNGLDDKERHIDSWRNRYNEAWVILVLDGSVGASMLRLHEQLMSFEYRSSFDRAFIVEFTGRSYKELRLQSP